MPSMGWLVRALFHQTISQTFDHSISRSILSPEQVGQEEGSAQRNELAAAEQKVSCVLDGNRTLESAPFSDGRTALHHAAARGDDFLVRLLLERGCQPHLKVRVLGFA